MLAERPLTLDEILGPQWRSLEWRLCNLYWIVDEHGKPMTIRGGIAEDTAKSVITLIAQREIPNVSISY